MSRMFAVLLIGACPLAHAANCTAAATGPAFGVYDPVSAVPDDSNGTATVSCTATAFFETVNFTVSYGPGSSGNPANRLMLSGPNNLAYNFFNTAARTQVLGNGAGGTVTSTGSIFVWVLDPTNSQSFTLYGRVPALQNATPGSFLDTVVVTVSY